MARKLRLEYPGPIYHVINRGNYRTGVFATAGAKAAFEKCLFEASAKSGWVLHAFVVMRNHYHLALETPTGNLVTGMQWLQATFANRFNRLRGERGHLFQGRYKALLVEEGGSAGAGVPLPASTWEDRRGRAAGSQERIVEGGDRASTKGNDAGLRTEFVVPVESPKGGAMIGRFPGDEFTEVARENLNLMQGLRSAPTQGLDF